MPIAEELLSYICCPKCKGDLEYDKERDILICRKCKVYYRIEDDIPVLIVEEAIPLDEEPSAR